MPYFWFCNPENLFPIEVQVANIGGLQQCFNAVFVDRVKSDVLNFLVDDFFMMPFDKQVKEMSWSVSP